MLHTLLPQINFGETFRKLDNDTLKKQRLDAVSLFYLLLEHKGFTDFKRRPISKERAKFAMEMWAGYEYSLSVYALQACATFRERRMGYDTLTPRVVELLRASGDPHEYKLPPWIGDLHVHRSHRSILVARNERYAKEWPVTADNFAAIWPVLDATAKDGYFLRISKEDIEDVYDGKLIVPDEFEIDETGRLHS
jgi:hypothetical protein